MQFENVQRNLFPLRISRISPLEKQHHPPRKYTLLAAQSCRMHRDGELQIKKQTNKKSISKVASYNYKGN